MGTQVSPEYIIRPPCMMQFYDALCLQGDQEGSVLVQGCESHKKQVPTQPSFLANENVDYENDYKTTKNLLRRQSKSTKVSKVGRENKILKN